MLAFLRRRSRGRSRAVDEVVDEVVEATSSGDTPGATWWSAEPQAFEGAPVSITGRMAPTGFDVPSDPHLQEPARPWRQP